MIEGTATDMIRLLINDRNITQEITLMCVKLRPHYQEEKSKF